MKILWILLLSFSAYSQSTLQQLTSPQPLGDTPGHYLPDPLGGNAFRFIQLENDFCKKEAQLRAKLPQTTGAAREALLKDIIKYGKACSVWVRMDEDQVVGFELKNDTAPSDFKSSRTWRFIFDQRNKQDINLQLTDDSGLTGRMSHDLLETTVLFVPRKVIPYIDTQHDQADCALKVILPTEEVIWFDAITKEIIAGVLKEQPLDLNPSRHHRKFAGLEYTGNAIMIRADRRAGTPEHIYDRPFNVNERVKEALITHKEKQCLVDKSMIWENTENPDAMTYFLYSSDQEFLDLVINPVCGWNLTMSDII